MKINLLSIFIFIISVNYSFADFKKIKKKAEVNNPEIIFPVVFDGQYTQTWGGTTFLICASIGSLMDASDYGMNNGWNGLRTTPTFVNTFSDSSSDSRWMFQADSNQTLEIDILAQFRNFFKIIPLGMVSL